MPKRGAVVFILAATLSLLSLACSKSPQDYLEAGKKHLEKGRYNEALIEFRNAVKKDTDFPEAHYQMGRLYMLRGAYLQALQEMRTVIRSDENRMDAHIRIGNLLLVQRRYVEAREKAEWLLEITPDSLEARILEANSWAEMIHINDSIHEIRGSFEQEPRLRPPFISLGSSGNGKPGADKAEELFRKIVDADGSRLPARLALGNFYLMTGRDYEAGEQYEAAARNDPQSRDAAFALGYFYLQTERPVEAGEQYNKYVELSKGVPGVEVVLPDFYLASGETDRGIRTLEKMAAENPETGVFKRRLASVFFDRGDFDKADELADELIKKDDGDAIAHYLKGRILLTRNKGGEAAPHLRIMAERRPGYAPARYFLGAAYMQNGETSKAASELESAVYLDPALSQARLSLARLKLETGNTGEAIQIAQKVLSLNPELDEARLILGIALTTQKDYQAAARELHTFVKNNPNNPAGMIQLGFLHMAQGDAVSAEDRFEAALKIDPDNLSAATELARLYVTQNRHDMAVQRLNQMLEQNPRLTRVREILGQVHLNRKDFSSAEDEYKKAVAAEPENAALWLSLARFYQSSGQDGKEVSELEEFIKTNPANIDARKRLINLYVNKSGTDKALRLINETLRANPKETEIRLMKADILMAQNKSKESIREIQTALEHDRNSKEAQYMLGIAYIRDKKEAQSESAFRAAVRIDSRFIPAWRALTQLKLSGGNIDAAIAYGRDALKANPGAVEMRLLLAEGLLGKKSYKDAIAELEAYAGARPTDIHGLYRLGTAYMEDGDDAKAESALLRALERNPGGVDILSALVLIYLRRNQPEQAISSINAQIQKAPAAGFHELLGWVYADQGNYAKAEEAFHKQASMDGNGAAGFINLASIHLLRESYDAAMDELQKVISGNPKSGEAYALLGAIYQKRKDGKKAMEYYRTALENDPSQALAANNLAFLLAETGGGLREAEQLARQALKQLTTLQSYGTDAKEQLARRARRTLKQLPYPHAISDTQAWIYYKRGAYSPAIDLLMDCVKQDPKNAVYSYHLGMAYLKNGNTDQAREALTRALDLNPDMPQASEINSVIQELRD